MLSMKMLGIAAKFIRTASHNRQAYQFRENITATEKSFLQDGYTIGIGCSNHIRGDTIDVGKKEGN